MQLNLIFNSDPDRYTGTNAEQNKIAYAASYLAGSAKEWFQPHMNEATGAISFVIWTSFVPALKAAFDDPDALQTAERKIRALKQDKDCSSCHAAFVPLATTLNLDFRTWISFFREGLNHELRKALSYQITLPDTFDAFVQICIRLDNQIRAQKETPRTQGGQFAPKASPSQSTSTGTHPGPMDLSAGRFGSQKRGPDPRRENSEKKE